MTLILSDPIRLFTWICVGMTFILALKAMSIAFIDASKSVFYRKNREKFKEEERQEKIKKLFGP